MPLTFQWVGSDDLDRVARVRFGSFATAADDLAKIQDHLLADRRAQAGDFLLAQRDGRDVGTTTSMSLMMCVRGRAFPCQGVAFVGTIKTERRKTTGPSGQPEGIATALMRQTLDTARQRRQVLSALMPFRASFYEHFGYGVVERRCQWTVPLSVLPAGDFAGMRLLEPTDMPALSQCRQRMVTQSQCDIQRYQAGWDLMLRKAANGLLFVDQPVKDGPVQGSIYCQHLHRDGQDILQVQDHIYDSHAALRRQLHFLASLKDQYSAAELTFPADLPLNHLLGQSQLPHRPVNHPAAHMRCHTRMQVRVLDHLALLNGMTVPNEYHGAINLAIHESEGTVSHIRLEIAQGTIIAATTAASPDIEMPDKTWASLVCGDLPADIAATFSLLQVNNPNPLPLLLAFSRGPLPFCTEYF